MKIALIFTLVLAIFAAALLACLVVIGVVSTATALDTGLKVMIVLAILGITGAGISWLLDKPQSRGKPSAES